MTKQKIVFVLVLAVAFLAMIGEAVTAHPIVGTVNNATDGTQANGHAVIIYYPGDKANYTGDTIGPGPGHNQDNNNMYMCAVEMIPNHTWEPGHEIYVEVIDTGDGYTAGPVSVVTTGAGYDVAPNMTLEEPAAAPIIVINEFVSDNTTEWVELYNKGSDPVNLTGWTLEDEGAHSKDLSSLGTIGVGDYKVYTCGSGWLNNPGDVIWLNDSTGANIDRVGYGTSGDALAPDAGKSTGRCPNGVDTDDDAVDFTKMDTPTLGAENECPIDTTAPTTEVTAPEMTDEPSPIPSGTTLNWTNTDVVLSFRSTDVSGVNYTNYSKTGETGWTTVNATIAIGPDAGNVTGISSTATELTFNVTVSDEGTTKIGYYSVDNASNNESVELGYVPNVTVWIDMTAPDPVTDLNATDVSCRWIQWNWTNPSDILSGFDHVEVWIDGEFKENVTVAGYKAEELTPEMEHTIGTRAVDVAGNVGEWQNDTETTLSFVIIWQGDIALISGTTFNVTAHNSETEYAVSSTTALGALDAAAQAGEFNYTVTDEWGFLFVDSIDDIPNEGWNGWMYWVNYPDDPMPMVGATEYVVEDGDVVTWYWSSSMDMTPEDSCRLLTINVTVEDITPPAAIADLATSNPTRDSITLTWTAPGDDGTVGTASEYDIRYSTSMITDANWDSATPCAGEPAPKVAGSSETFTVTAGLSSGTTYYFAIKTADEVPNRSPLSNVASETTERRGGGGGGGGAPRDTDGDGYSDIQEMIASTDKDDPCDPDPECAACLASKPAATPTPTAAPTPTAKPTTPPVPTPEPTPEPTATPEDPGFEAVFAIAGLLAVAYLALRRKRK